MREPRAGTESGRRHHRTRRIGITLLVSALLMTSGVAWCQFTVSGSVSDTEGASIPGATIAIYPDSLQTLSDSTGRFRIEVSKGTKTIAVSSAGFEAYGNTLHIARDRSFTVRLIPSLQILQEFVIEGRVSATEDLFDATRTSSYFLSQADVKGIPVLGGEADVIKTLQLLPGTVRGVEGSSDLFVRGGAADQNLVLLDNIPIYNTSHLFGFLSVFNPDVLDHVEAINGGFPAEYGGRLSSVLDVRTKSDIPGRTHASMDVGLISSRIFVEQPIAKDKASIWVAGRRTYIDQVMRLVNQPLPYYFYDLNAKVIVRPGPGDQLELSHYSGIDELSWFRDRNNDGDGFYTGYNSGNSSQSLRWNHQFARQWSSNASLIRTRYNYHITNSFDENELTALSDIEDYGARFSLRRDSLGRSGTFSAGLEVIRHNVSPGIINTTGSIATILESSEVAGRRATEVAMYSQYEWQLMPKVRLNAGLRGSMARVGDRTYHFPEPRISARYNLNEQMAIKASYSRMAQYMHRISNSAVSTPTDLWYPVTESVRPQTSHQFALAAVRKMPHENLYVSVEGYYKFMNDLIGYEEGTNLFLNNDFESQLIQGKGRSYGIEVLLKKDAGRLSGWISYTLSWSWRQYDEINNGRWFPARYDRRHNAALVAQYALSKRWAVSMVWEFMSGARFTPVIGQYIMLSPTLSGVDLIPVYPEINSVQLANTHRLDLGLKFTSKPGAGFHWQLFAGAYNVYNRANPIGISIEQDETDGSLRYTQPGLFGFLPFISYGFGF